MALGSIGEVSYDIISRDKTAEGLTSAGDRARQIGKVAGAAMTGIGVGMIALTDSAKKTNATIRMTALQLGVTTKEMRELTLATTNVTFPIEEVTASFDLLTRAGMTNKEEIAATATAYDTLGDAIGKTASEVTGPMVTAMKTFGLEMTEGADYTDKMTYLLRNTTLEMDNFSSIIAKIPPDMVEMGLTMDDTIALLGLMEESGLSGAVATREFEKAVTAARKTGEPLNKILGITSKQMDKYKKKLEGAEGMTKKYAKAANTQYGTMDKIKQSVGELTLKYGSMLEPLDALGPAMSTLGPIMIMMSTIQWGTLIPALAAHATAAWATIAPYLVIIAPIVAVIAILYVLEKKFGIVTKATEILTEGIKKLIDWFRDKLVVAFDKVKPILDKFGDKLLFLLGPIGAIIYAFKNWKEILGGFRDKLQSVGDGTKTLSGGIQKLTDWLRNKLVAAHNIVKYAMDKFGDKLLFLLGPIGAVIYAFRNWREILRTVKDAFNSVISYIGTLYNAFLNLGRNLIQSLINGFTGTLWKIKNAIGAKLREIYYYIGGWAESFYRQGRNLIQWFISGVTGTLWKIKNAIGTKLLETYYYVTNWFRSYYNLGKALIKSFINGFTSKIQGLKDEISNLLWWIYNRLPHSPVKMGPLVEEPDWESYLIEPMRTAKISPSVMFESGMGGGVGASRPTIEVKVEATIYNYSDVEEMERMVAEATARGIHDAYGMR